jgi:hypothetical protein
MEQMKVRMKKQFVTVFSIIIAYSVCSYVILAWLTNKFAMEIEKSFAIDSMWLTTQQQKM